MPIFYFKTKDGEGASAGDTPYEFPDVAAAVQQAQRVLGEMALDGIPRNPGESLLIEVEDQDHRVIGRIHLDLGAEFPT